MSNDFDTLCSRFDDYLNGDLSSSDRARFHQHLDKCQSCREAVDQQQWIDNLLRSDEAAAIDASPPTTLRMRRPSRRRIVAAVLAASVAAALAAPFIPLLHRKGLGDGRPEVASLPSPQSSAQTAIDASPPPPATIADPSPSSSLQGTEIADKPIATFASNGNAIAVPLDGEDTEVTVVRLVPTVAAQVGRVHLTSEQPFHHHGG
jgi:hypothetical protein